MPLGDTCYFCVRATNDEARPAAHIPGMATTFPSSPMMRAFAAGVRGNVPTVVWGDPGVGKTAKIGAYAAAWGFHTETVVGSIREASDFLGLPIEVDGEVRYSPPAFARRAADADRALINFDELTTSAPSVSKAMLRIFQEREVGELPLPATVALVAAANPPAVAVDGWELPPPIANRLMHLEWVFDADEWLTGVTTDFAHQVCPPLASMLGPGDDAAKARVRGAVTAYLRAHRDQINALPRVERRGSGTSDTAAVDPQKASGAWPSPRSWTNAMAAMEQLHDGDEEARYLVVKGCVGEGAARSYLAWLASADLYDPEAVLADPAIVGWHGERPDKLFALLGSVTALAQSRGDRTTWEQAMAVMAAAAENGKADLAIPGTTALANRIPAGAVIPRRARDAFGELMTRRTWAA